MGLFYTCSFNKLCYSLKDILKFKQTNKIKMDLNNKIKVCIMGGTISATKSHQNSEKGFKDIPKYLKEVMYSDDYKNLTFCNISMKDSSLLDQEDRDRLWEEIKRSSQDRIVVPHGLLTMEETGEFINERVRADIAFKDKVIELVGSEKPLNKRDTEAIENLEFVINDIKDRTSGVYMYIRGEMRYFTSAKS